MILKEVVIENYLCYYGIKIFELAKGLNIILGENGEGKTKYFEALDWLFRGDSLGLERLVSVKALSELAIGGDLRVRVSIVAEQFGEQRTLTKSFICTKVSASKCTTSNFSLEGIEETQSGERSQVDGKHLLEQLFPTEIRRYSLFKGESELDIFNNEDALITLINSFSDAKHYEKYSEKGEYLRKMAEKAVDDATKTDTKNQSLYKRLQAEIDQLEDQRIKTLALQTNALDQIRKTESNLQEVEHLVNNADALEVVNKRIRQLEQKISETTLQIDENYTTKLFDDCWILIQYERFHKRFLEKVMQMSAVKREAQSNFDREEGMREGAKRERERIINNSVPLPVGVPSRAHMEEMIREEICKVCNRPARKHTPEHDFMIQRLEEYFTSQIPKEESGEEKKTLFKKDYVSRLLNLATSHDETLSKVRRIQIEIKEFFEFNDARRRELEELNHKLASETKERENIVGNSTGGADKLVDIYKNYNAWQKSLTQLNRESVRLEDDLKKIELELQVKREEKEGIDTKSVKKFLLDTRSILRDIEKIFKDTKVRKFGQFIALLEGKANDYFWRMNKGAFVGSIKLEKETRGAKTVIKIELQENERLLHKPNQSLLTSMHISILFAISELAKEQREESFPMVFDAPTSSFGDVKTKEFLNIIAETGNQIILLMKNFIIKDSKSDGLVISHEFAQVKRDKAFWVKINRPFDSQNLETINTEVINL
ncbi:AAA family ATPase [Fulvivirgaceae bacterium PWU5]|uniref:AAA family ATPase n=1 Tax=Dawidia cretensis TaxID=2782350 RepID=A0AAP2E3D0_9BACT|nr:AAA family ATPase [Dawidia cretensis]MBT1712313.1 AAA family ATPase [Dawidia cretensis]